MELINGEIITKMTQDSRHATALTLVQDALRVIFPASGYVLRNQMPLALGVRDRPEPDIAVVQGSVRDFAKSHPETALRVLEVHRQPDPMAGRPSGHGYGNVQQLAEADTASPVSSGNAGIVFAGLLPQADGAFYERTC